MSEPEKLSEQAKAAFSSAADWSKQLVTLSTGIVTLTVTFSEKVFGNNVTHGERWLLWLAWVAFLVAILAGVIVLGSLTGALSSNVVPNPTELGNNAIKFSALAQLVAFVIGVAFIVAFGFTSVSD